LNNLTSKKKLSHLLNRKTNRKMKRAFRMRATSRKLQKRHMLESSRLITTGTHLTDVRTSKSTERYTSANLQKLKPGKETNGTWKNIILSSQPLRDLK